MVDIPKIEQKARYFFSSGNYLEHLIPKLHIDIIENIKSEFNINIEPDFDRNYKHSTDFSILINKHEIKECTYDFLSREEISVLRETEQNIHWAITFQFSLVDNVACYYWNTRQLTGETIEVVYTTNERIPATVLEKVALVFPFIIDKGLTLAEARELKSMNSNCLNDVLKIKKDYQPSLHDVLFGSLDFYNAANI